jgi:SAM-dependent methyltransferase
MRAKRDLPSRAPIPAVAARPVAGGGLAARLPALAEAWRGTGRRGADGRLSRREIEEAGAALLALQRGLTGDRRLAGERYMERSDLLGAYLLYYWPVSYTQVSLALAESTDALSAPVRRVLDLGSGPGPASAALLDALAGAGKPSPEELVLADASRKALDLGSALLAKGNARPDRLSAVELDLEAEPQLPDGDFDLILMGHCLNELWRSRPDAIDRRASLLRRAGRSLAPGGLLLLVEPALLVTSRELIALRDLLTAEGWSVAGPCPGSYPCPALAAGPERSCHAESPWAPPEPVASLAAEAGLDRSSVKWMHILLRPEAAPADATSAAAASPTAPAARRVVSEPMLNKAGRLRYLLCGEGSLATISARADDRATREAGFAALRRGDLIRAQGLEERPSGGLGFVPATKLEIVARAPEASR